MVSLLNRTPQRASEPLFQLRSQHGGRVVPTVTTHGNSVTLLDLLSLIEDGTTFVMLTPNAKYKPVVGSLSPTNRITGYVLRWYR